MNKNKKIILIITLLIILIVLTLIIYTLINKDSDVTNNTYISYELDEECLEYVNNLEEINYTNVLESDYANMLYLYNETFEASYCDDEICTADLVSSKEDYLVCVNSIYYVNNEKQTDLKMAIDKDKSIIQMLEELDLITVSNIIDNKGPVLVLNELTINYGSSYDINDFVESCTDNIDEQCILEYQEIDMQNYTQVGSYDITILASDQSGNQTGVSTTLTITKSDNTSTSSSQNTNSSNASNNTSTTTLSCKEKLALNSNPSRISGFIKYNKVTQTESSYKYGVEVITTTTKTYAVFSDIGECLYKESSTEEISDDRSGYNATEDELKEEAKSVLASNLSTVQSAVATINEYRREVDLNDLEYSYNLSLAATMRAIEMYWSGVYEHIRPDGTDFDTVMIYLGINFTHGGENIAYNYSSLSAALVGWKNSTTHYENITTADFVYVGFGYYENYYVNLFSN